MSLHLNLRSKFVVLFVIFYFVNGKSRPGGPSSEHGNLCNATYTPNLFEPLKSCTEGCDRGFECFNDDYCCPTKDYVCLQQYDSGRELTENVHYGRYAFNPELGSCSRFSYFGAHGNFNNFGTFNDCMKFCK